MAPGWIKKKKVIFVWLGSDRSWVQGWFRDCSALWDCEILLTHGTI